MSNSSGCNRFKALKCHHICNPFNPCTTIPTYREDEKGDDNCTKIKESG